MDLRAAFGHVGLVDAYSIGPEDAVTGAVTGTGTVTMGERPRAEVLKAGEEAGRSSIAGWKAINESDMLLKPDLDTAVIDPFFAQTTLILICDVLEPTTGQN